MHSLALALRAAARAALPEGAFLRRDRGGALFVTDAPRHCPAFEGSQALSGAGFLCETAGGLARLTPGPGWLIRLERAFAAPPDAFSNSLSRFAGLPPEPESLRLFALGAKRLDGAPDDGRFERRLRQRAAECLRLDAAPRLSPRSPGGAGEAAIPGPSVSTPGGGLYACALLKHILEEVYA